MAGGRHGALCDGRAMRLLRWTGGRAARAPLRAVLAVLVRLRGQGSGSSRVEGSSLVATVGGMTTPDTRSIDRSRYRVAAAIVDRYRAGESVQSTADDFFSLAMPPAHRCYIVELIVAASDHKGRYEPK